MTKTCVRRLIVLGGIALATLAALATLTTLAVPGASAQWNYLDNNADIRALTAYGDENSHCPVPSSLDRVAMAGPSRDALAWFGARRHRS